MKEQVLPLLKELESSKTMLKNLIGTPSATLVRVIYQFFFFFSFILFRFGNDLWTGTFLRSIFNLLKEVKEMIYDHLSPSLY